MPKLLGALPISPSNPAWARVAQPVRIADKCKLIKDETDEALSEIFEHEAQEQRCRDSDRLQHPAGSAGLFNPQAPSWSSGTSAAGTFNGETSSENSSQLGTTEFFNDPTLVNLFDQALVSNQQLRILAENIRIANNEVLRRRGTYLPLATLGTGASLNKYSYNTLAGADNLARSSLQVAATFPHRCQIS